MQVGVGAAPEKVSQSTFDKSAWNKSEAAKISRRKYRHDKSKWTSDAKYLSKPIVSIDGEGINTEDGNHLYILLAISGVKPLINRKGLATYHILDYIHNNMSSDAINVIYGGSYDFNCWVRDLDEDQLKELYHSNYTSAPVYYEGFQLRWIKGKGFEIERDGRKVVINDVVSFFQCPFVQACDEYLGADFHDREMIVREKARRGNFSADEIENIAAYNDAELVLIIELVTELRARLNKVNLRPRRWDGPGAIAAALFMREGVKAHIEEPPEPVAEAARFAYAGGHFELVRYGSVTSNCYEYDINSAYPRALTEVPSLAGGTWRHYENGTDKFFKFAMYRVSYRGTNPKIPGPLFCRGRNGTVSYPLEVIAWIWSPELAMLKEYCAQVPGAQFRVLETWEFRPATSVRPFAFIGALYEQRRALKRAEDGAHVGIKLGLNSMYGKLAQQTGYVPGTSIHPPRIPKYHCLTWAGYATSWCRAEVMRAALKNLHSIIAFETDALFSSEPLELNVGEGLGQWEETVFTSLTYVQSGHYYATKDNGKEVVKCRGIDRGFISRAAVEAKLANPEGERQLDAELTRFFGAGIALVRGLAEYWCRWKTEPKQLNLMPTGKRVHGDCECSSDVLDKEVWHYTFCPTRGGLSHEYPIAWVNPDPEMSELAEMREAERYFEDWS